MKNMKKLKIIVCCLSIMISSSAISQIKTGYIDKTGKEVIPKIYDDGADFSEGMAGVVINGKWGFIDTAGTIVIEPQFEYVGKFSNELAKYTINSRDWGFIDKTGSIVIPASNTISYYDFQEDVAVFQESRKSGFIDKKGKIVINAIYDNAKSFSDGLAVVKLNNLYGFIDKTGKEIIPIVYDEVNSFHNDVAFVKKDNLWNIIDKSGNKIVLQNATNVVDFGDELGGVLINDKWGYINQKGKIVIEPQYLYVSTFKYGVVRVKDVNNQIILINKENKVLASLGKDDGFWEFSDGVARTMRGIYTGIIDVTGKVIIPINYNFLNDFNDGRALIKGEGNERLEWEKKSYSTNTNSNSSSQLVSQTQTTSSGIQYSSYALDIFNNLGSMAIYVGDTMYVVLVKGKNLGNVDIVSARAAAKVGVTNFKYQWFSGNNCEGLKAQYGSVFNVRCGYELSLD